MIETSKASGEDQSGWFPAEERASNTSPRTGEGAGERPKIEHTREED